MNDEDRPGLQAQRTALAWIRTAIATNATAVLVLRASMRDGEVLTTAVGVCTCAAAGVVLFVSFSRQRDLKRRSDLASVHRSMFFAAASVGAMALLLLWAVVDSISE